MVAQNANIDLEKMLANMASRGVEQQTGLKIPTSWAAAKDFLLGSGTAWLSENGAPRIADSAERIALSYGRDETQAADVGRLAENAWRAGVPLIPVIYESACKYKDSIGDYLSVGGRFSTVLKAQGKSDNFYNAITSDLEVVNNERKRLADKITNDSKSTVVHAASTLPAQIGSQLDKMITDLETSANKELNPKKKNKKGPSDPASKLRLDAADKINKTFDELLKSASDGKEGYKTGANVAAAMALGLKGMEDLESPVGRVKLLESLKQTYFNKFIAGGATGVRKYLSEKLSVKSDKELQHSATVMIGALAKHLEKNASPVELNLPGCSRKSCTLEEYIVDIFAQHQKDSGRKEIPSRMQGRLKEAASQIAEAMCDPHRLMHADALMFIVDKKHGIAKFDKGEMCEVLHGEALDDHLAKLQQKPTISRVRKSTASAQYQHMQATPEHFRQAWNNLAQEEKFVWSTFLSNEVLADVGVSAQERKALRHQDNEYWQDIIQEVTREMSRFSNSELKTIGLNDSQITQLGEALKGISRHRGSYVQKHRAQLTELVADAATLMDGQKQGFIKDIVNRTKERRDYKSIVKEKQKDKSIAEQVLSSRDDEPENSRY